MKANDQSNSLMDLRITNDSGPSVPLDDNSGDFGSANVKVYFRDQIDVLCRIIRRFPVVIGCVAWLTSKNVLRALADVPNCQIVVQKEDFLRPDRTGDGNDWHALLRSMYQELRFTIDRYSIVGKVHMMSCCGDPTIDAVRCVGNHNAEKNPAWPRMHNKFLVFGDIAERANREYGDYPSHTIHPKAVWTGSLNLSETAAKSFENAVLIESPSVAKAYLDEWQQILAVSEPLDWQTAWAAPEWRIGT